MHFLIPCAASIDFLRMLNILYCANMSSFFFCFVLPFVTFCAGGVWPWWYDYHFSYVRSIEWGFFDLVLTFCTCVLFRVGCVIFLVVLLVTCANQIWNTLLRLVCLLRVLSVFAQIIFQAFLFLSKPGVWSFS